MSFEGVRSNLRQQGTSKSVEADIQQFHSSHETGLPPAFDCTQEYQLFSNDPVSMIRYSSEWFNEESGKEYQMKTETKKVEWFNSELRKYYDIGYAEKLSLFKENKMNSRNNKTQDDTFVTLQVRTTDMVSTYDHNEDSRDLLPKQYSVETTCGALENTRFIEDNRNLKNEIGETTISKIIVKDVRRQPEVKVLKKCAKSVKTTRQLRSSSAFAKRDIFLKKHYADINQKLATSRFGRTRKVIDFRCVDSSDI